MDAQSKALLRHLRQNCRKSFAAISRETKIPASTLFERLKLLESNVIVRHTTLPDFEKLGFGIRLFMAVDAKKEHRGRLQQFLLQHANVNSVQRTAAADFCFDAFFRNMQEATLFQENLESLKVKTRKQCFIVAAVAQEMLFSGNIPAKA